MRLSIIIRKSSGVTLIGKKGRRDVSVSLLVKLTLDNSRYE